MKLISWFLPRQWCRWLRPRRARSRPVWWSIKRATAALPSSILCGKVIADVAENGITGHEVAASPDGGWRLCHLRQFGRGQPGTDGANIVVVDVASHKIVGNIAFDHGVRPHCAVFGRRTDCSTSRRRSTAQ